MITDESKETFVILLIGDRDIYSKSLYQFSKGKCLLKNVSSIDEALTEINQSDPHSIILDLDFIGVDQAGIERIRQTAREAVFVTTTTSPSVETAVKMMKLGARDHFVLPGDMERIRELLRYELEEWTQRRRGNALYAEQKKKYSFVNIIAKCEKIKKVIQIAEKVSQSNVTGILIRGETGTGKELIARAVHYWSGKENQPFIELNCTAIPESLLEAELFGYEKGAFTDAKNKKKGLLELANGGSLFLDEIGDMSLQLQAKIVKAIEEKRFRRLGGTDEIEVSVRILAATNQNLEKSMSEGLFRSDLYYRLNVVTIELPPLRERETDILLLADHFIQRFNHEYHRQVKGLSSEVHDSFLSYNWPGNVRELKNAIERAVLLGNSEKITINDLPDSMRMSVASGGQKAPHDFGSTKIILEIPPSGVSFGQIERIVIEEILSLTRGNKSKAAKMLSISRPRLLRKLEGYLDNGD